jgi:hypothetical protein
MAPAPRIVRDSPNAKRLIPKDADGDTRHRLGRFTDWLDEKKKPWYAPDLHGYRKYLFGFRKADGEPLEASTIAAHLHTVRACYRDLLLDEDTRDEFFEMAAEQLERAGQDTSFANRQAIVEEIVTRWKRGTLRPVPKDGLKQFDRKALTTRLVELVEDLASPASG